MRHMMQIAQLLTLAAAYKAATGLAEDKTVSSRAFGDSKKLSALKCGSDITVGRFNATVGWFADNWPSGAAWPADVPRPARTEDAA